MASGSGGAVVLSRALATSGLPFHMLTQSLVDIGLVAPAFCRTALEPRDHIGINAERELLLHRSIEDTPLRSRPIANLGYLARINLLVSDCGKRTEFGTLLCREPARIALPHTPSFRATSPYER